MQTWIYRCSNKPDLYIYLAERDDFSQVPAKIMTSLGNINFAMELELHEDTKLARENAMKVMNNLKENGFHLQLPPPVLTEQVMKQLAENR
jgi:uncharacterized protein YcgL (UPF0745 family)